MKINFNLNTIYFKLWKQTNKVNKWKSYSVTMFSTNAAPSHDQKYSCTSSLSPHIHFHLTLKTSHLLNIIKHFATT